MTMDCFLERTGPRERECVGMTGTPEQLTLPVDSDRTPPARQKTPDTGGRLAYRPAELAAMVGLSVKAIYRAVGRGELEAARVANGTRLLIPAVAADEWLAANAVIPRAIDCEQRGRRARGSNRRPLSDALDALKRTEDRV